MKTRELLRELLHRSGLKASRLAEVLHDQGVRQSLLSRYLSVETKEPKRSTLEPVAAFYGISVDAFFDEEKAEELLAQIASGAYVVQRGRATRRTTTQMADSIPIGLENAARSLAHHIDAIDDPQQREAIGQCLLTLARAPDSSKALDGVLLAFASAAQPAPSAPAPVSGIAGQVLARQLSTETSELTAAKAKGRQPT